MAKRPNATSTEPIDIFSSPRLEQAMLRSTAPVSQPSVPEPAAALEAPPSRISPLTHDPVSAQISAPDSSPRPPRATSQKAPPNPPAATAPAVPPTATVTPEVLSVFERNVPLKFQVPYGLRSQFQGFKAELSGILGVLLDDSNIARPYFELLLSDFRDRIVEAAQAHRGQLRRPAHGDAIAMAEFDEALGGIIREALRRRPARVAPSEPER